MSLETQKRISQNLRTLRCMNGMTQTELSEKIHMDRSYYTLLESGRRNLDLDLVYSIAKLFGIKMELLFETEPERIISEAEFYKVCENEDLKMLDLFHGLTPFSKGRLIEKAEVLAEGDAFRAKQHEKLKRKELR